MAGRRPGDAVTVWYDSASPAVAVLDKSPPARRTYYRNFAIIAGAVAIAAAVAAAIFIASIPAGE
jgi:hypothetical protein